MADRSLSSDAAKGQLALAQDALRRIAFYPLDVTRTAAEDLRDVREIALDTLHSLGYIEIGASANRVRALLRRWEEEAAGCDQRALPANAYSIDDQVEERRNASRLRLRIRELRDALDG